MARFFKTIFTLITVAIILITGFYFARQFVIRKIYPLTYEADIMSQAKVYDLDPYFVCAVIWAESGFDENAESSRGARGLMQIMPDTGQWVAEKNDIESFHIDDLYEPDVNIMLGCWYLKYLENRFDGDITLILAAYNGGPNRVAEWLKQSDYSDGETLHTIPLTETKEYVEKVLMAYEIYQTYYSF